MLRVPAQMACARATQAGCISSHTKGPCRGYRPEREGEGPKSLELVEWSEERVVVTSELVVSDFVGLPYKDYGTPLL
jgi:hypothetical protein